MATRNLHRHLTWSIPSGQAVAAAMGVPVLGAGDLSDIAAIDAGLGTSTPLWFYILREADVTMGGLALGPVGGRIVAEVFMGLLDLDAGSYVAADPGWTPTLPTLDAEAGFQMIDLLTIAGVDPISRGQ